MSKPQLFPPYDADSIQQALNAWEWMLGEGPHGIFAVAANGNVVIQDEDGGLWLLDTWNGTFEAITDSEDEFHDAVRDLDTADDWFMLSMVIASHTILGELPVGKCYGWKIPLMLSGELSPDNVEITDVATQINMCGQIAEQCKDLPPGTTIDEIQIHPM